MRRSVTLARSESKGAGIEAKDSHGDLQAARQVALGSPRDQGGTEGSPFAACLKQTNRRLTRSGTGCTSQGKLTVGQGRVAPSGGEASRAGWGMPC